jgi:hypothetical protein
MSNCVHCHKPLNQSQYNAGKTLKSCPKCSSDNGSEHVYYPYPAEFGTTSLRSSSGSPEGAQSYCVACRSNLLNNSTQILCSDI